MTDLSADALKRTGVIAGVGGALVGTVGIAGFAASKPEPHASFGARRRTVGAAETSHSH